LGEACIPQHWLSVPRPVPILKKQAMLHGHLIESKTQANRRFTLSFAIQANLENLAISVRTIALEML
jgi:hypothetical protein